MQLPNERQERGRDAFAKASSPKDDRDTRKILAVHSGALGDCILFAHLLQRLDGDVTLLAGGSKGLLLKGLGAVARCLDFDALPMHELFSDEDVSRCSLAGKIGGFGRLVSCFGTDDQRVGVRLATASGVSTAEFLPIRPPDDAQVHLVDLWADMLGLGERGRSQAWPVPAAWRKAGAAELKRLGVDVDQRYCVIHPGAGAPEKCWPLERFVELAGRLDRPVFVLGPVELDRWPASDVDRLRNNFPVLLAPELETLAGVLARAGGYVGNDSGASHLAGAVGAPAAVIFGPTSPHQFAPLGPCAGAMQAQPIAAASVDEVRDALMHLVLQRTLARAGERLLRPARRGQT